MSDFQSGLEAFAKSAYQKYLEVVLKGRLGLEEKEISAEQEKEFKEDVQSIYTISKVQDVATVSDLSSEQSKDDEEALADESGNAICFQSKNSFPAIDENGQRSSTNARRSSGDSKETERKE